MHIVGLTGGIACGKTTVASTFREEGLAVIDLDAISRQATKTGHWGYRRVVRAFGRGILTTDASGEVRLHTAEHRRTPFLLLRLSLSLSLSLGALTSRSLSSTYSGSHRPEEARGPRVRQQGPSLEA